MDRPAALGRACGFTRLTDGLHGEWLRSMIREEDDMTLLAHRGSYKTTCLSLAITALLFLRPERNLLFLRKTDRDAAEMLLQVKQLLLSEPMQAFTARLYGGEPVLPVRATGEDLVCNCRFSLRGAPQLHGQGINGSLTGKHADLIFTDDIVNLQDRISEKERLHTRQVWQELHNIRNPGGRILSTGTPWHPTDAISLMPAPRRFDCYTTGLLSPEAIEGLRQRMEPSLFAANYELRHIPSAGALFPVCPPFTRDERLLWDGMAHLDASYGGSDSTALTCGARRGGGLVLYGRLWHRHVDTVLEEILSECRRLRCAPLWLEVNGDKGYLARDLRRRGAEIHPYTERMNKHMKIATYLRGEWPGATLLRGTDPEWIDQITGYIEGAAHDDAPDSAASLCRALSRHT